MHARDRGMDLVEVQPKARPVVCKLMDYGRFKYEQKKKTQEAKKKEKSIELHTVRFRPNIEEHDFETKRKKILQFLLQGDKVKVDVMFRRREMRHSENGTRILDRITENFNELARLESREDQITNRNMSMVLSPIERKVKEYRDRLMAERAAAGLLNPPPKGKSGRHAVATDEPAPDESTEPPDDDDDDDEDDDSSSEE